jgi:hypothetical protein
MVLNLNQPACDLKISVRQQKSKFLKENEQEHDKENVNQSYIDRS